MFTYGRRIKRRWLRRRLQSRPNPLLGLIYCQRLRRSATGQAAAYHVGTQRQHLFLLLLVFSLSTLDILISMEPNFVSLKIKLDVTLRKKTTNNDFLILIFFFCMLKFSMMTPMKRLSVKKEPKTMKKTKYKYIQSRTSRLCCSSFYSTRTRKKPHNT